MDVNNDPFYPHRWTEEDKAAVRNSVLWPLIVAAHYGFSNKLYVSYKSDSNNTISMGLLNGVQVIACLFTSNTKEYRIRQYVDPILATKSGDIRGSNKPLIISKNVDYIIKKFNNLEDEGNKQIHKRIADAENRILQSVLETAIRIFNSRKPTKISVVLDQSQAELALNMLFGGLGASANQPNLSHLASDQPNLSHLASEYSRVTKYNSDIELFSNKIHNFFDKEKWIAIKAGQDTPNWIIGRMKTDYMASEILTRSYNYPKLDSSTMTIPFNLYAGFDYTPFREEFIGALTLCKVAREGKDQPRVSCIDPEGLIPSGGFYSSEETGLLSWDADDKRCLMFDKLA